MKADLSNLSRFRTQSINDMLGVSNEESAMDIDLMLIKPFKDHPFHVNDDEKMSDLVESIKVNGVLSPVLLRPADMGTYEMISGHRRMHAAKLAGLEKIPAIIRDLSDDEATIVMVDSNIQREELLPSEKAFAYKMRMDAMKRQGSKSSESEDTSTQNGWKSETAAVIGQQTGESKNQVRRYIRLTELIPDLLKMLDNKRLQFTVAVEISYIDKKVQEWLLQYLHDNGVIKLEQVTALRAVLSKGPISQDEMIDVMNENLKGRLPQRKVILDNNRLKKYFPPHYTESEIETIIFNLLNRWKESTEER